jgi:hypothetical protein
MLKGNNGKTEMEAATITFGAQVIGGRMWDGLEKMLLF